MHNLRAKLQRLNKCKYALYSALLGKYDFDHFSLNIDDIQVDPFAPPSKITIEIPLNKLPFDFDWICGSELRKYSFCDAIARIFARYLREDTSEKGSGNSGFCGIRYGNQKILKTNAVRIENHSVFFKVLLGLPGFGRTIAGHEAQKMFLEEIPQIIRKTCVNDAEKIAYVMSFIRLSEQQHELREACLARGIVAFVANSSLLARSSSTDDKPMSKNKASLFQSPKELECLFRLSDGSEVVGMAIPQGITLITGSGFHGKSTLIQALSQGIYNHIPDDGREFCLTDQSAVLVRAEDGRFVEGTDISMFVHNLPENQSSQFFQTDNASGSTSQAANFIEALEIGTKLILMDEDISATNFLIRDNKMRCLIPDEKETITPLIDKISALKKMGVSLIMVTGALGEFLELADTVIVSEDYQYYDLTKKVQSLFPQKERNPQNLIEWKNTRKVQKDTISYEGKRGKCFIDGSDGYVKFGRDLIDFRYWSHICDVSQYGSIASVIAYAEEKGYFSLPIDKVWQKVADDIKQDGYTILESIGFGHLSRRQSKRQDKQKSEENLKKCPWRYIVETRPIEWHAALNRLRSLKCIRN